MATLRPCLFPPLSLTLVEGSDGIHGVATYELSLSSAPLARVVVDVFDVRRFVTDRRVVTVVAFNDDVVDGGKATSLQHNATSDDVHFNFKFAVPVHLAIVDNDASTVVLSESQVVLAKSAGNASEVRLGTMPLAPVTVLCYSASSHVTVQPNSFLFSPSSWNDVQNLNIVSIEDSRDATVSDEVICTTSQHRVKMYFTSTKTRRHLSLLTSSMTMLLVSRFIWNKGLIFFSGVVGMFKVASGDALLPIPADLNKRAPDLAPGTELMMGSQSGFMVTKMELNYLHFSPPFWGGDKDSNDDVVFQRDSHVQVTRSALGA
jgi:hypothetical protein